VSTKRKRTDYRPGPAAADAIGIGETLFPKLSRQAVIDRLIIAGLHALRVPPPPTFWGGDRFSWVLPKDLRLRPPSTADVTARAFAEWVER
jgi:hypothetical protein